MVVRLLRLANREDSTMPDRAGSPPAQEPAPQAAGALNNARKVADAEQSIADAEQTIATAEDTLACLELGEADSPSTDHSSKGVDRWRMDRARADARKVSLDRGRVDAETVHTQLVLDRFEVAEERDQAANSRDEASAARDAAATARDRRPLTQGLAPAVLARQRAAADRGHSAGDRAHSGEDRRETQEDREALRGALTEAHMDALTGVYQRAMGMVAVQTEIDRALRANTRLTLAFVDVDDLKIHNDAHGHAAGDELLRDVAASIQSNLRPYDPVVRYGGDEFICALSDADVDAARARFADISRALHALRPGASVSVGFARLEPGDTLDELISRGDAELYDAKRRKRSAGAVR